MDVMFSGLFEEAEFLFFSLQVCFLIYNPLFFALYLYPPLDIIVFSFKLLKKYPLILVQSG